MKKVLSFLGNVLIVAVLIVAIVMTIAIITSTKGEKARIPNLFGYALLSVQTDSMESDQGMFVGDLIVERLLSEDEANNLKVGDVITFVRENADGSQYLETHRIVENVSDRELIVPEEEIVDGIWTRAGDKYYTTRGDNTPDVDRYEKNGRVEYVYKTGVVGIWLGVRIPKLGAVMDFLQTSMGFMVCIVIPVALFFIYQLYIFIMTLTRTQKEKALKEVSSKEEELKQKAIAEYLAQQQAAGGQTAAPDTKPAEPESEPDSKKKRKNKRVNEEATQEEAESDAEQSDGEDASEEGEAEEAKQEEAGSEEDKSDGEDASEEEKAEETEADSEEEKAEEESETDASNGEDESEETEEAESEEKAEAEEDESYGEDESEEDAGSEEDADAEPDEESDTDAKPEAETEQDDKPETETADPAHTPEISEEEKERIIREYLAKQAKGSDPEE